MSLEQACCKTNTFSNQSLLEIIQGAILFEALKGNAKWHEMHIF